MLLGFEKSTTIESKLFAIFEFLLRFFQQAILRLLRSGEQHREDICVVFLKVSNKSIISKECFLATFFIKGIITFCNLSEFIPLPLAKVSMGMQIYILGLLDNLCM